MRIAHVTDVFLPRLGGIERQVHNLATRQSAAGHDVSVITAVSGAGLVRRRSSRRGGQRAGEQRAGEQRADGQNAAALSAASADQHPYVVHRPPDRWRSEWTSTRAMSRGRAALRSGSYDVVHAHVSVWSPMAAACVAHARRTGLPVVVTVHSVWGPYARRALSSTERLARWRRWPVAWSAVSGVAAEPLQAILPAGAQVVTLPNGIDPQWWHTPRTTETSPAMASVGERRPVRIVAVMRFAARKRGEALIDMLEQVRRRLPAAIPVEAVIVGDGPRWAKVRALVAKRGLDWIQLPGRATAEQVRAHYASADVFVAPSLLESFGIAALEARCAGLPVVAFAQSGVRDIIGHEREGLLAGTDAEMVDALVRLCADDQLRCAISTHNRATAPPFDWEATLRRCDALYAHAAMLASGGRPDARWATTLDDAPAAAATR